jgi:hypothetical protein
MNMKIRQSISFEVVTEVTDDHTEQTGKIAADAALRLIVANELPGMELGDCQIVEVEKVTDIHIENLEVF